MKGYAKERAMGTQLLKKISSVRATAPREDAVRTGVITRELIMSNRNCRKGDEDVVTNAPAREPRPKATRVAPNAISMNFMANELHSVLFRAGVR